MLYKKTGNQNFMIIKAQNFDENDYKFQMVINNDVKYLLPIKIKTVNNDNEIYYETTSMISLKALYEKKLMGNKDITELVKEIKSLSDSMKEYLLDTNNILFDPEYIFVERQSLKYYFCYYPVSDGEIQENMRNLFDKILQYINHNDKTAVEIAYAIQQITISDSYSIQDLLNIIVEKAEKSEEIKINPIVKEENVYRIPEKKTGFLERIKSFILKSKYQDEDELPEFTSTNSNGKKEYSEEIEDATVFLAPNGNTYSVTLRSTNLEDPIVITPNIYPCIFGKSRKSSDYVIDSPVISRVHMRLSADANGYYVEDLNSTNGTYVNSIQLTSHELKEIKTGDLLTIANIDFIVE